MKVDPIPRRIVGQPQRNGSETNDRFPFCKRNEHKRNANERDAITEDSSRSVLSTGNSKCYVISRKHAQDNRKKKEGNNTIHAVHVSYVHLHMNFYHFSTYFV